MDPAEAPHMGIRAAGILHMLLLPPASWGADPHCLEMTLRQVPWEEAWLTSQQEEVRLSVPEILTQEYRSGAQTRVRTPHARTHTCKYPLSHAIGPLCFEPSTLSHGMCYRARSVARSQLAGGFGQVIK